MSIFRTSAQSAAIAPAYTGLQLQTSSNAVPIPIPFGKTRISQNLIWYGDFQAIPQISSSGGGKGGGGGGGQVSGYAYYASVAMALGEGPVSGVDQVWIDRSATTLSAAGLALLTGTTPQTPWSYLTTAHPDEALGYNGVGYVVAAGYSLGSSASLGQHDFEVRGLRFGTGFNSIDADPALVISDLLTSDQFGAGFPADSMDDDTLLDTAYSVQTYWRALGLAISPAIIDSETAQTILQRILDLCNAAPVWSAGALKLIPYADAPVLGNGYSFVPQTQVRYFLDEDDFQHDDGEDPVKVSRADPLTAYNVWSLEALDRDNAYNLAPVQSFDQDAIERFGLRIAPNVTAHEFCDLGMANISAQLMKTRNLALRNTFTFKLPWEFCLLDPMDVVAIAQSYLIDEGTQVRITGIDEDSEGILTLVAAEFVAGVIAADVYSTQSSQGGSVDTGIAAPAVNVPLMYVPPVEITDSILQIWFGASGSGPNWGGANVYLSLDDVSYSLIGTITSPVRQGVLTASLGAYSSTNPDTVDTLSVDLTESSAEMTSATSDEAAAEVTLSLAGAELMSFQDAVLTSAFNYDLTTLYRGLHGTIGNALTAGASFTRLDGAIFKYTVPSTFVGMGIFVKFQSFNAFGDGEQDLATCAAYSLSISGPASDPPTNLSAIGGSGTVTVQATAPNASIFSFIQFYRVTHGAAFNTSTPVGVHQYGAPNATLRVAQSMGAGTYDFYAAAVNSSGVESTPFGPVIATVT